MAAAKIPIVPQWNLPAGCVATPDEGFLYVGLKTINYISQIKGNTTPPEMKIFNTRQTIKSLDCDSDWSKTKYFAVLAEDNSVQIWDFDQEKAVFGHKAHFAKRHTEGDSRPVSHAVHMGFMSNRNILSICSNELVIYCVASNTYCKRKQIIPRNYNVTLLKCSPFNDHIFAVGTQKGLIILADLKTEQILYTLNSHGTSITSINWNGVAFPGRPKPEIPSTPKCPQNSKAAKQDEKKLLAANDDIFDIYDYDYLENEFGIPCDTKQSLEVFDDIKKNQEEDANTNFNYVEACESLKLEINALKNDSSELQEQVQVTLEDCMNVEHRDDTSCSGDSNNSVELLDKSSTDCSTNKEKFVLHQAEVHTQEETNEQMPHVSVSPLASPGATIVIASASSDGNIWIWDTKTGAVYDQLNGRVANHGKNNHIETVWINSTTLLVTSRSGIITSFSIDPTRPGKFKQDATEFPQQGVVTLCRSFTLPVIWTISSYREIICQNLETNQIIAKYGCASTNVVIMREQPNDMNKIAIAFSDSRIGIIDISAISATEIPIENYTNKINSPVYSLVWGPNTNYLAFGTKDGSVGVLRVDNPKERPFLFHPVSGKPIYSIDWKNKYIYVCCNERVALYRDNRKNKDPYVLEYISEATAISVHNNYLFVGTQTGYVNIFKQKENLNISYELIRTLQVDVRYVTEIAWNPITPHRFAVATMSKTIRIFDFNEDETATLACLLVADGKNTNHVTLKWSNRRNNMLVTSGFDGCIRVYDVANEHNHQVFLKQFSCPMTCAMFLPADENIILCAGRNISIELVNMLLGGSQVYADFDFKKLLNSLDVVRWGTKITSFDGKSKSEKRRKKRNKTSGDRDVEEENGNDDPDEVSGLLTKLQLEEKEKETVGGGKCKDCKDSMLSQNPATVLYLTTKEIYKDNLERLNQLLDSSDGKYHLLTPKLFSNQADARHLLESEIENHQNSVVRSVSSILIHQMNSNLIHEIQKRIESKTLTEWHVSLAPSISYMFWKKCCHAYVNQLLEKGYVLQAATYLIALHDIKQAINMLLEKQYFKEALVMAKIHCQSDDKIVADIAEKWINYFVDVGNLISAAYICAASGQFHRAHNILSKTRNITPEIEDILQKISKKSMKI